MGCSSTKSAKTAPDPADVSHAGVPAAAIKAVEKVLGVPTFVMKGEMKVYLFKLEPHDEVMMRTWIGAISQELAR